MENVGIQSLQPYRQGFNNNNENGNVYVAQNC